MKKTNQVAIAKEEKNITDVVLNKVSTFAHTGELVIPEDYSPENALKSAWLALQTVEDRNGNKALNVCSQSSIANSLLDMVVQGLSPAKKQCYFIVYGKELQLSRSYMGTVAVAKRFGEVVDVKAQVVYQDDEFEYRIDPMMSSIVITTHSQKLENIDNTKIKAAYAVVTKADGTHHVELMTIEQIRKAWGQGATKGSSPAHKNFAEEMAKKTVINRACKLFINTSDDSAILSSAFNRTSDNDYHRKENVVIDVDDADITEVKDAAENAFFGAQTEETEVVEEMELEDVCTPVKSPESLTTPSDEPVSEVEGQISMEECDG